MYENVTIDIILTIQSTLGFSYSIFLKRLRLTINNIIHAIGESKNPIELFLAIRLILIIKKIPEKIIIEFLIIYNFFKIRPPSSIKY